MERRPFESDGDYIKRQSQDAYNFAQRQKRAQQEAYSRDGSSGERAYFLAAVVLTAVVALILVVNPFVEANTGVAAFLVGIAASVAWFLWLLSRQLG